MHQRTPTYNTYRPRPQSPQTPRRSFRAAHLKGLLILALVVGLVVHTELARRAEAENAAAYQVAHQRVLDAEFKGELNSVINQNPQLNFSVAVLAGENAGLQVFGGVGAEDAASTAKLITATAFLHKVETGQTSLSYQINDEPALTELKLLINQSDDGAWTAFNTQLGHDYLQSYAYNLGLSSYSASTNTINTADLAKLAELLYNGKLLSPAHTRLLLSYMQHTNYEDFIPPAIPAGVKLYHKVGIDDDQVNDVGIIVGKQKSFVIAIFSNGHGIYNWPARAQLMQAITKAAEKAYL